MSRLVKGVRAVIQSYFLRQWCTEPDAHPGPQPRHPPEHSPEALNRRLDVLEHHLAQRRMRILDEEARGFHREEEG